MASRQVVLVLSRPATVLVLVIETTTADTHSFDERGCIAKPTAKFTAPVDYEHEHRFAEHEFIRYCDEGLVYRD